MTETTKEWVHFIRHPDDGTLHAFVSGTLSEVESDRVAAHVEDCSRCCARMDSLPEDPFVEAVRAVGKSKPGSTVELLVQTETEPTHPAQGTDLQIPGLEIIGELGRGGMGVVYHARDVALDRDVALKLISEKGGFNREELRRFRNEARSAASVRHPNMVEVFTVGESDGSPYLVMEYVPDGTLEDHLRNGPMDPLQAAQLAEDITRATAAAHRAGVIHRDLKPSNILLLHNGTTLIPKITDFGLAKQLEGATDLTRTGVLAGTPAYMSPEQADGDPTRIGPASDVYSLGTILYQTTTGRPPFQGMTPLDILNQVRRDSPVAPSRLVPGLPRDLETITLKCLEKEPRKRYLLAQELAEDLRRWQHGEPIHARPVGGIERALKWTRRNRVISISAAVVLLSLTTATILSTRYAIRAARAQAGEAKQARLAELARDDALKQVDRALRSENEARQQYREAVRQRTTKEALTELFLNDLIGQAHPVTQMFDLAKEGRQGEFVRDPKMSELLDRVTTFLTDEQIEERYPGQPFVQAELLMAVGNIFKAVGRGDEAIDHLERAVARLQTREKSGGTDQVKSYGDTEETFLMPLSLAAAYESVGRVQDAVTLAQETLTDIEAELPQTHYYVMAARNDLATYYLTLGQFEEAVPLLEQNLEQLNASSPQEIQAILLTKSNLGTAYYRTGRFSDATPMLEATLKQQESTLGKTHPDTVRTLNNLAGAYVRTGRHPEAVPMYQTVLEVSEAQLGSGHPITLIAQSNLGSAHLRSGEMEKAVSDFETAYEGIKGLQYRHPMAGTIQGNLIRAYEISGRYYDQERILRDRLDCIESEIPIRLPTQATVLRRLGHCLVRQSKFIEAESVLRPLVETLKADETSGNWEIADAEATLGEALVGMERFDKAERLLRKSFHALVEHSVNSGPNLEPSTQERAVRLSEVAGLLAQICRARGSQDELPRWEAEQEKWNRLGTAQE